MKRGLSFVLLLLYAVSFTELHQMLRLPLLVEHYHEHSAQTDLSFWEFLVMHYETDVAHDDTDMRLPFKTCDHSVVTAPAALLTHSLSISAAPPEELSLHQSLYLSRKPTLRAGDIFQPPKI
ncbi:MAG: hypothetical protein ACOYXA_00395 [Bacteroidota bacterium]